MFSRNGLRSTFPSPGAIGVRAYGAAIEERIRERRLNRLHAQELRRQELQKKEQRKARECLPNKTSQFSGEYGGQDHNGKLEKDQKPVMNLRDALALDSPGNRLFFAEEPQYAPVQMEHGNQSGEYQYEPLRESLFDCISNGVLDMDNAGRVIYEQKQRGDFDQAEYDEFVKSEDAMLATPRFDMYDDMNDLDDIHVLRHNVLANRLMGEITRAHLQKISQSSKSIARAVITSSMPKVSLGNLSKPWRLQALPPFVELDLVRLAERWFPRKNDNTFQQLTSLYRSILLHATDPPYRIKEFAVRVNKGGSRNENLKDLPSEVEATLIGFGEDITGYGSGTKNILNLNGSRSCTTWETNASMDSDSSAALSRERNEWQSHLLKSLQRALTDVRSYGYDAARDQWFSNNRQKQATMQEKESVAAYETVNTENRPPTNLFA
ncbi:hypothetical protein Aduo_012684 [Ancylostoma duodenale]